MALSLRFFELRHGWPILKKLPSVSNSPFVIRLNLPLSFAIFAREDDLKEAFLHTWVSSNDKFLKSIFNFQSIALPDWSGRVT